MTRASTISLLFVTLTVACASGCLNAVDNTGPGPDGDAGANADNGTTSGPQPDMAVDVKADFNA
jgi:hypothetical protein